MNPTLAGLHHVTAITANAQANIDFYCGVLGLRLVKLTVNFDDPTSYHLYYGDYLGRPGSIITFFAWPGGYRGIIGPPQVTAVAFAAPAGSLEYWSARLSSHNVTVQPGGARFGEPVLGFSDPDGLQLEIVLTNPLRDPTSDTGPIPAENALRGFHGITVSEGGYEKTARLLTDVMGFRAGGSEGNRFRYRGSAGDGESVVDILCVPDARRGSVGAGAVHHVAFRTPDDDQQQSWRRTLVQLDYDVSPVMDRTYFHSIYYREPGGVLFEIATDPPGFTVDEPLDHLGTKLRLPPALEAHRAELELILPKVRLPQWR